MRFNLHFTVEGRNKLLPYNYQYPLSAWIYKTLARADETFAKWLHDQGYSSGNRQFKMFTFSQLNMGRFRAEKQGLLLQANDVTLTLSFWADETTEHFIRGVFMNQRFSLGNKQHQVDFLITSVEKLPDLHPSVTNTFTCLSPILVTKAVVDEMGKMRALYLHPEDPEYSSYFFNHMIKKYTTAMQYAGGLDVEETSTEFPFELQIVSKPKKKGMIIKEGTSEKTQIIPYTYDFKLTAPPELASLCWHAGFGEKNSLGLGCTEVVNK